MSEATIPLDHAAIARLVGRERIDVGRASIRELNRLVDAIERELSVRFIRMEFGIPGLPTPRVALEAERRALEELGLGHVYAPFDGLPALKQEAARFARLFFDVELPPACCVPTLGAMEGCFAALALAGRMSDGRRTVLCLEPGFPVNKSQLRFLGLERASLDFYDCRGPRLIEAVERRAAQGDLCAVLWSSPNNPSWIALDATELAGLARACDRHGLIAIEDLAYFGMDTRQDYLTPGVPPYQPTVLQHGGNAISLVSSSKIFSYAGQRVALAFLAPALWSREAPDLARYYGTANVGHAFVHGVLYPIAACVAETPQHGLLALLKAANAGDRSVFAPATEYARRAAIAKRLFLTHGFRLVYDNDLGQPLGDGFYFTISHPAYEQGSALAVELLHYGISAITLETTGSVRHEGLRACVSLIADADFPVLEARLRRFAGDHPAR